MNHESSSEGKMLFETCKAISNLNVETLKVIAEKIVTTSDNGGFVWVVGNGGSASTGAHLTCDLGKGVSLLRGKAVRAISLNELTTTQSAWGNDFGFDDALSNQLRNLATPNDVLICFSGSGKSPNIVSACKVANEMGVIVISILGENGGPIEDFAQISLRVASSDMQVIENLHLVIVHWLYKYFV